MDAVRLAAEERRKILQEESKLNQQKANYEDELARRRYGDQLEQQKRAQEETLRRQEESVTRQEQIRQQSVQKELQMREQERKSRIKEEAEIKAKVLFNGILLGDATNI
jgi:ATPase family AAA domain-containing protein 3A/B